VFPQRRARCALTALACFALCACGGASLTRVVTADSQLPPSVELRSVPFHPQTEYQCGPAALATSLGASGVAVAPEDLVGRVFVPQLQGSLQAEMIAAIRGYDRLAYLVEPDLAALVATLAEGWPVLVLQNLGVDAVPFWHYAVVVGYDVQRDRILLRSGEHERLALSTRRFEGSWRRAQHWGVVIVKPDDLPASARAEAVLQAAAGLESAQHLDAALAAYGAAAQRWPNEVVAQLGLGNVHYRQGRLAEAEVAFRALLSREPDHAVARNNLAQVLLEQGRPEEALREVEAARAALGEGTTPIGDRGGRIRDPRVAQALAATESAIRAALSERAARP